MTTTAEATMLSLHQEALRLQKQELHLLTALRRIVSLDEKNVPKYAQEIARAALALVTG